uniref:Uncharacterized protein n=1 Tax=Ditylenchus dipsaci TaxID=166011 RepID=A0A915CNI5_9BILA
MQKVAISINGRSFPLEDLAVLNIFQQQVWDGLRAHNTSSKVESVKINDYMQFEKLLLHCSVSSSVKIWYNSMEFVKCILERLRQANVKMRSLDVYPYSDQVGMSYFKEFMPNITGMTMRPHAKDFFFSGLPLERANVELPKSLTTLEWQNRNVEEFRRFLPNSRDFAQFIDLIQLSKMNNLRYLLFKFSKLENLDVCSSVAYRNYSKLLGRLQFLKFDLCYGDIGYIVNNFLAITGPTLKIISLNIISDETLVKSPEKIVFKDLFGRVAEKLDDRNVYLHLGLLQRETHPKFIPSSYPKVSKSFERVLSKFEASFVTDYLLIHSIFQMRFNRLTDIKFIQCNAVNNDTLCMIATNCLQLRRLSVLHCKDCCEIGIRHFVEQFHLRHSPVLKIVSRFWCKIFNETKNGETVLIWSDTDTKQLYIQDYDEMDRNRVLGIVLPDPIEELEQQANKTFHSCGRTVTILSQFPSSITALVHFFCCSIRLLLDNHKSELFFIIAFYVLIFLNFPGFVQSVSYDYDAMIVSMSFSTESTTPTTTKATTTTTPTTTTTTTTITTTAAPTTTTAAPTTTTAAPTTTTAAPTTTTAAPTTTTAAPTTSTAAPTTTTAAATTTTAATTAATTTTAVPTTAAPTTTSAGPTTVAPTTAGPTTPGPTTAAATTAGSTTADPLLLQQ